MRGLARAVDAKDSLTFQHSARVSRLAGLIAATAGWDERDVLRIRAAAYVHDVGKLGIDDAILRAPRRLTPDERHVIELHPGVGAELLANDGPVWDSEQVEWVRHHHERPDGAGYPDRLTITAITPGAAILALADSFDVMVSDRPYKQGMPASDALGEVAELCGRQFVHFAVRALESCDLAPLLAG